MIYSAEKFFQRNGRSHSDFTAPIAVEVEPAGERFTRPVALLTNRRAFSSTEYLILAMKSFPHVTVVGDTTGGGLGNPTFRDLPNGWTFRLSRWIQLTAEGENFEGIGIAPHAHATS